MNNNLEKLFRESLDKHEMPYDSKAWEAVQKQLPGSSVSPIKVGAISVAAIAVVVVSLIVFNSSDKTNIAEVSTPTNNEQVDTPRAQSPSNVESPETVSESIDNPVVNQHSADNETHVIESKPVQHLEHNQGANQPAVLSSSTNDVNLNAPDTPITSDNKTEKLWLAKAQKAYINSTASIVCLGKPANFTVQNLPEHTTVDWYVNGIFVQSGHTFSMEMSETNTISAKLIPADGMKLMHSLSSVQVGVYESQDIIVSVTKETKNTKPFFVLENKNNEITSLKWSMDLNHAKGQSLGTYLTEQGRYAYTVTGVDQNGCSVKKEGEVSVDESYNLFTPSAFSPNGDGINETFIPVALLSREVEFKMSILDRSGNLIYETTDRHKPWTGSSLRGGKAQLGNYVWVVTLINEEGLPEKYSGTIVITE